MKSIHEKTFEEWITQDKPLLAVDFDGVLHNSSKGYHDGTVYDTPTPGAQEFIRNAMDHFEIVVFSARARTEEGANEIRAFLDQYGFPEMEVTAMKPPAFITLDDRAVTFTGTFPDPEELMKFQTWVGRKWKE